MTAGTPLRTTGTAGAVGPAHPAAAPHGTDGPTGPVPGATWRAVRGRAGPALAFLALLVVVWEVMARLLDSLLVPGVPAVAASLADIVGDGSFVAELGVTVMRVALGFACAAVVAVPVGIAMGRFDLFRRFAEPAVLLGLTVPGLVWALLCVIWFGIGLTNPVVAIALSSAPPLVLTTLQGVRSIDTDLLEMAHVYRFPRRVQLRRLWLPALSPALFAGTRLGLSLGWKVVVLVEVFGMSSGVGYQLNNAFGAQDVAGVLAWTLLFAVVMAVLEYGVLQGLERRTGRWRKEVTV